MSSFDDFPSAVSVTVRDISAGHRDVNKRALIEMAFAISKATNAKASIHTLDDNTFTITTTQGKMPAICDILRASIDLCDSDITIKDAAA